MKLDEDIKFIDFHSHRAEGEDATLTLKNLFAGEEVPVSVPPGIYFSAGIHPWHLTGENAIELKAALKNTLGHPRVIAVGEAGFDPMKGPSKNIQYDVFIYQAKIAEEFNKPVVIHAVRAWDVLRKAKKEVNPSVKWIIHGFRGKAQLASDLVSEGFMISLGVEGIVTGGGRGCRNAEHTSGNRRLRQINKFCLQPLCKHNRDQTGRID